jgi:serine/threonine protein kinase
VESLLARTAASWIYRARSTRGGDEVLLEVMNNDLSATEGLAEHLEHETTSARRLGHPHIAFTHSTGFEDGLVFVATRDPGGFDLGTLLKGLGAVSLGRASNLVSQTASALDAAHAAGLVHGTLEPARVMVDHRDDSDHVAVTGFGLRGSTRPANGSARPYGLPAASFAPPEQIRGDDGVPASDVYALGCLLYYLLVGRPPFERDSEEATLAAHIGDAIPAPRAVAPELPAAVDDIVQRSLAKDPADRYESPADLASELEAAVAGDDSTEDVNARKEDTVTKWDRSLAEGAATWSPSRAEETPADTEPTEETDEPPKAEEPAETEEAAETDEPAEAPPVHEAPLTPGRSRRPAWLPALSGRLAAVAVAILAAAAVAVMLITGESDTDSDRRAGSAERPRTPATPTRGPEPGQLRTWPKRDAFTAIIHVAVSDPGPARATARRAALLGYQAGVLDSSDYSSLPPGRTVAFAGVFASRARAQRAARRLAREGVAAQPYVRFVNGAGR